MESLCVLLLSAALIHTGLPLPAASGGGGRGLDSVGGVRRQRRDLQGLLPYEDPMTSYAAGLGGGGANNNPYYQLDDWRGRGLDQALKRLVERDRRREEEEEEQQAYLAALLRLLSRAENRRLEVPDEVEVVEEEEDEDQEPQIDLQGPVPADYDETGRGLSMGRPQEAWWGLVEPRLAQALLDRMDPGLAQTLLQRANQERLQQVGPIPSGRNRDQETLRRLVARILSSVTSNNMALIAERPRRSVELLVGGAQTLSPAHRRRRRSVDDPPPPSPSNDPPLLRVKRLEEQDQQEQEEVQEEGQRLRPHVGPVGLQRMKRIDATMLDGEEEVHLGRSRRSTRRSTRRSRRSRRSVGSNYDQQILIDQILEYMRE